MKPLDIFHNYFRVALRAKLKEQGWGSQGKLADETRIGRNALNDYLRGARNISEDRKERIVKVLGATYEEMIAEGRKILLKEGEPADLYPTEDAPSGEVVPFTETIAHPSFQQACQDLKTIFESGNANLISAISANLSELSASAGSKAELDQLKAETEDLKKRLEKLEQNEPGPAEEDMAAASGAE